MLPPPNFLTQLFVSQTCNNSTKRFHFHFLGHKHVQTILAKSLSSDASVACCFDCILEDSRILLRTAISFECFIKTHICRSPLPECNSQCSQGLCIGFLGVSHLALSSATVALFLSLFRMLGRTNVGWLSNFKK